MSLHQKKIDIKRRNLENAMRAGSKTDDLKLVDPEAYEIAQDKALKKQQLKDAEADAIFVFKQKIEEQRLKEKERIQEEKLKQ